MFEVLLARFVTCGDLVSGHEVLCLLHTRPELTALSPLSPRTLRQLITGCRQAGLPLSREMLFYCMTVVGYPEPVSETLFVADQFSKIWNIV